MTNQKRKGEILTPPPFHVERYAVEINGRTVFTSDRAETTNLLNSENKRGGEG